MSEWTSGNRLRLLENGEEYFPRLFEAIDRAREEILLETFIWFEDEVGGQLQQKLIAAARRGVAVQVLVDGYGTPGFSEEFLRLLQEAGVRVDSFDPQPTLLRIRTNFLCRMHRKVAIIDARVALVGGINMSAVHLRAHGDDSKQDYAVEVQGPAVRQIRAFWQHGAEADGAPLWRRWRYWLRRFPREMMHPHKDAQVLFVYRDNEQHPTDIETMYRFGIRAARESIVIACAYFFPGYRFVRDLREAVARGVDVRLIMQGNPDQPFKVGAAAILFDDLLSMGVRVFLYEERPLHAKVAVIDRHWATVGSSNLDPSSLGLNLEANLFILDEAFNGALRQSLERILAESCRELTTKDAPKRSLPRRLLLTLGYHLTRRMPNWGRHVPYREQLVRPLGGADGTPGRKD
jgi:cardiolipin synthase A/B